MNLKKKKQLGSVLLAISLATTGCGAITKDEATSVIEEMLDSSDFYQDEFLNETNEEFYGKFYNLYLNHFIDYMSKKQYKEFKEMVTSVEEIDRYDYDSLVKSMQKILCKEGDKGVGIYAAFNTEFLYEELTQAVDLDDNIYKNINTLMCLINDNESFYKALFSRDIDDLKNVIVNSTGAKEDDVLNLITLFDEYYMHKSAHCFLVGEKEDLENKINEVMKNIILAKYESDVTFARSFYGRMMRRSVYFGYDDINITRNLLGDKVSLSLNDAIKGKVTFDFDIKYLYSKDIELWELKYLVANAYIDEAYVRSNDSTYTRNAMELISFLLSPDCTLENTTNAEELRCELYKDLGNYFDSSDDFADFLIRLFNRNEYALNRYFDIFKERLNEDGIDMLDFLRYESLRNLVKGKEINNYYFENGEYMSSEELRELPADEASEIASVSRENYYFDVDYDEYFKEIDKILANNDLGISRVINESASFNWWEKPITITDSLISTLVSEPLELKERDLDGVTLYYYEAPRGFEEGVLSELFYNIDGNLVTKEFPGIDTTMIDPDTKELKFITVVSINKNPNLDDIDLKFINPYPIYSYDYNATEEEKKLLP